MRLKDKVAVITGAGSGMGRTIATLFAKEGAKISVADISKDGGKETSTAIRNEGGTVEYFQVDVTKSTDAEYLAEATTKKFGKIDILVNNAGICMKETPFEQIQESLWDQIYAVNVKGIFLITKYVVPVMKNIGGGTIVNMASTIGFRTAPLRAPYASSKGAVISLTLALAFELAPYKIRVNYIAPGLTDTPMSSQFTEEEIKMITSGIRLGRIIKTEDVANAALYLASEESAIVTGTGITVDGGLVL